MLSEITVLLWSLGNEEAIEKILASGANNIAVSVEGGDVTNDFVERFSKFGKRVLARTTSSREAVEELCMVLDTVDILVDFTSAMFSDGIALSESDLTLGLDPTVYRIYALVSHDTWSAIAKNADPAVLNNISPIFVSHGPAEKIIKALVKGKTSYLHLALTFIEYADRPQFYLYRRLFSERVAELIIWSVNSLDNLILESPVGEVVEEQSEHILIECIKTTSVRVAPSFSSRIDSDSSVKPGDRYKELEERRAPGSTALFSRVNIEGKDRWVLKSYNSEEYFVDVK